MSGALSGLKVVDLSRVLAGPLCTQMLADHGAQVIKVEPPSGDETRHLGPPFDENGVAAYFGAVNRGKRAITLDLTQPDARATLEALLEEADILVENFLPGTLERWNLGYETLHQRHPSLIYCSISGFGADGPLGGLPGYDAVLQAMCGVMSINGTPESGATRVGIPIVDYVTGYNALAGILLALQARHSSGWGQRVEVALFDTALSMLVPHAANWLSSGRTPERLGSAHPNIAPYDKFQAGDGELFLGIVNDGQFRRFCTQLGRDELATDRALRDQSGARAASRRAARRDRAHPGAAQGRGDLRCADEERRAGRRGEHGAAGLCPAARHASRDADRAGRIPGAGHPGEAQRNAGPSGAAAAKSQSTRRRNSRRTQMAEIKERNDEA